MYVHAGFFTRELPWVPPLEQLCCMREHFPPPFSSTFWSFPTSLPTFLSSLYYSLLRLHLLSLLPWSQPPPSPVSPFRLISAKFTKWSTIFPGGSNCGSRQHSSALSPQNASERSPLSKHYQRLDRTESWFWSRLSLLFSQRKGWIFLLAKGTYKEEKKFKKRNKCFRIIVIHSLYFKILNRVKLLRDWKNLMGRKLGNGFAQKVR